MMMMIDLSVAPSIVVVVVVVVVVVGLLWSHTANSKIALARHH